MEKLSKKKIEKLAYEIRQLLLDENLWVDITIYFNGKALSTDDRNGHFGYNDPDKLYILEDQDPKTYFEFAGGCMSMSFEGDFYEVINYGECPKALKKFEKLLKSYGLYYELGHAWNMSMYPL